MDNKELVAALRSKASRDNRALLDAAADRIEELEGLINSLGANEDETERTRSMWRLIMTEAGLM